MGHRGWRPWVMWDSRAAAFMSERHRVSGLTFLSFPKTFWALGRWEIERWCCGSSLTSCRDYLLPQLFSDWNKKGQFCLWTQKILGYAQMGTQSYTKSWGFLFLLVVSKDWQRHASYLNLLPPPRASGFLWGSWSVSSRTRICSPWHPRPAGALLGDTYPVKGSGIAPQQSALWICKFVYKVFFTISDLFIKFV